MKDELHPEYGPCDAFADHNECSECVRLAWSNSDYGPLAGVYELALFQAANGKGKDRHADNKPFENQIIMTIQDQVGSGFTLGQCIKKMTESKRLATMENGKKRASAELLGAMNYLAAAYLHLQKTGSLD